MHRREARIPGSDSRCIGLLFILWCALGCVQQERTASFRLRERISFGVLAVSVEGWEPVGEAHAPLSSLRAPDGEKAIAVFVSWSGLEQYAEQDRQAFAETFLHDRLKLVDGINLAYKPVGAMTREIYYFSSYAASMPRDWVVVFHVGADSGGYSLRMRHPDSRNEQFDVAVVPLG